MNIGEKIRTRREEMGLNCKDLAEAAGISLSTLQDIESGKVQFPQFGIIQQLESALDTPLLDSPETEQLTLGEKIWLRRMQLGLSRSELAKIAGLHRATIINIETGVTPSPRGQTLHRIREALKINGPSTSNEEHTLGEMFRARREELGLTQAEIAKRAGIHRATVANIEKGNTVTPAGRTLRKMADALSLDTILPQEEGVTQLGEEISRRRDELGYTRAELARKTGLHKDTIANIEKGATSCPSERTQHKIGEVLGISLSPGEEDAPPFRKELRMRRIELGMNIGELARAAGVSRSFISALESGRRGTPHEYMLGKVKRALQIEDGTPDANVTIGEVIHRERVKAGLSLNGLSQKTGIWSKTLSQYEKCSVEAIPVESMRSIEDALGIDLSSFYTTK